MRAKHGLVTFACVSILAACSQPNTTEPTPTKPEATQMNAAEGTPITIGNTYVIKSDVLGMERNISVRLPYGYAEQPERKFPVVYVIDGGAEQDFPHIAGIVQSREMNGTFSAFILIGIETVNRRAQITPPAVDPAPYEFELGAKPGGSAQFRDFIRQDLMPWVNDKYRTNNRDVIMGESLGGLFVIESLFEAPTLFDDYIAVTPSLWWENMKYGKEAISYLSKMTGGEKRLYITSADEGYRHQGGIDLLISALESGAPDNLTWAYTARGERETHGSIYHVAALDAFRKFFPAPTQYGRPGPLLSGVMPPPRTPEQDALLDQKCDIKTALQFAPGQNTGEAQKENVYRCIVYHYGDALTAGNMTRLTGADAITP